MITLTLTAATADALQGHFEASAPREDGAFLLLRQGISAHGVRLMATELIIPPAGAWEIQESDLLRPCGQWLSAVIGQAIEAKAGLLWVHSHPKSHYPPGLSPVDERAFHTLGAGFASVLDGPLAAAVVHPFGWAGVVWLDGALVPMDRITCIGRTLRFLSPLTQVYDEQLDTRQQDALGDVHQRLRNLTVGIVGLGGLGSPMAEQLVRMGVREVIEVDDDLLDTPSNVRRVFGSKATDLEMTPALAKVDVVGGYLDSLGLDVTIRRVKGDVRSESVFRELLDADVVLVGTDTHGSRAVINDLASVFLLPVIDVGVRVGATMNEALSSLSAEVRVLTPTTPCLWCRRSIDGRIIMAENLPNDEREQRKREGYLAGNFGEPVPSVIALTVLASGLATCALLALLSEEAEVAPSGYVVDGFLGDGFEIGENRPDPACKCQQQVGLGDEAAPSFISA
ncbi:ThiF family adenylyltransferase [Nitrolancea hollandica]|uniref:THIF-type NAD/FAD binding fold domain-containing protein n=1 Tax=Nitrolancea hollandica Lb TaxID=1129897 RepID=I4EKV2_9BACT|nr:ThiF family adenylyltransferase [Nitrolancea hollandica]CCF85314.1 conserved hypothetical protein [Nitrolancea hollandica Lb]